MRFFLIMRSFELLSNMRTKQIEETEKQTFRNATLDKKTTTLNHRSKINALKLYITS